MKKYAVRLKNRIINKNVIVKASEFSINAFTSKVHFKDEEGKNVAVFSMFDVDYINIVEESDS